MTENDYIAEFIKERYISLLGIEFTLWKCMKIFSNFGKQLSDHLSSLPKEELDYVLENLEEEESE